MTFHPFDGKIDDPKSISTLTFESLVIGLLAIGLGTLIDKGFKKLQDKTKIPKILLSIIQIIFGAIITAIIYLYGPSELAQHFQRTLPGMLFPALFYGVQSAIYAPWQAI